MGVWIETTSVLQRLRGRGVTPYVGVWIETSNNVYAKHRCFVTPYVGVWIETLSETRKIEDEMSLLMWECGLKPLPSGKENIALPSLLMWECGLKLRRAKAYRGCLRHSLCGSVD